ncbi:MAG: rhodanese-like domain-containing protein [Halioglobus sp.]
MNTISTLQFKKLFSENDKLTVIDVRSPVEFKARSLAGATNIPLDVLSFELVESHVNDHAAPNQPIYLMCKGGHRAKLASEKLPQLNQQLVCIEGGMDALDQGDSLPFHEDPAGGLSLERQVRIAAGSLVLLGVLLGSIIHPSAYFLSGFVGAGLVFAGITNWCGMGLLLAKMPWNKA